MGVGSSESAKRVVSTLAVALTFSAGLCFDQSPARAGNPFGGFVGGVIGGVVGGMAHVVPGQSQYRSQTYYRRPQSRNSNADTQNQNGAAPSPSDSTRALAALAPPSSQEQVAILKSVNPTQSLGAVGSSDDATQVGQARDVEADRDYTSKVEEIIQSIKNARSQERFNKEGDVTEHAILESLDSAIKAANLQRFETFLGENWSGERLRVMILERVQSQLGELLNGTTKGDVSMHDLDLAIAKAAKNVYARLFETSELLAANRGSTLFLQRLYQAHGDLVSGDVRESAEQLLEQAAAAGVTRLEPLLRRDANAFALRYRAQRIVYDCLSDNIDAISSSDTGMVSSAEISQRLLEIAKDQCGKWVDSQLISPDDKLKPQDPMPLRVIWTAEGPKEDASMYGRATDDL
jgi:hypothetical protein